MCGRRRERAGGVASVGIDARQMTSAPDAVEPMRCEDASRMRYSRMT
eukprot:SAG31_NODE_28972_length_402_cov_3.660066_1_plen_46_part_10